MTTFTSTFSPDDNKFRLYASQRLDTETYTRAKNLGFKWAPKQDLFVAPAWSPDREDFLLELCGEIDDEDTTLIDRAEVKADRLNDLSDRKATEADRVHTHVKKICDGIPFGQPILVGHHSEKRARRDAKKIENGMRKAVSLWDASKYWQDRAAGALRHAKYLERVDVRARRIKKLEAEKRSFERNFNEAKDLFNMWLNPAMPFYRPRALAIANVSHVSFCFTLAEYPRPESVSQYEGPKSLWSALEDRIIDHRQARNLHIPALEMGMNRAQRWIDHLNNRLIYERAMIAEQGGTAADKFNFEIGGQVKRRGQWFIITKINREAGAVNSVSVIGHFAAVVTVDEISGYREPKEGDTEKIKAATKLPPLCNYPGNGFLAITDAQWKEIYKDHKTTEYIEPTDATGGHRVRTIQSFIARQLGYPGETKQWGSVCVFINDAKIKEPAKASPKAEPATAPAMPEIIREAPTPGRVYTEPEPTKFDAMKDSLKAGVQTVCAPQLFPTPPAIAEMMVEYAEVQSGECVLEPSAGTGNIIDAVLNTVDTEVLAYEINQGLCFGLSKKFPGHKAQVKQRDFLEVTDFQGCYPKIIMNPPFENGSDIKHILHAITFLKPGGRLVALCANGPRQNEKLKPLADHWEVLPENSFKNQGTGVNVALMVYNHQ